MADDSCCLDNLWKAKESSDDEFVIWFSNGWTASEHVLSWSSYDVSMKPNVPISIASIKKIQKLQCVDQRLITRKTHSNAHNVLMEYFGRQ